MQSATPPSQSSTDSPQNTSLKRAMSSRHLIMLSFIPLVQAFHGLRRSQAGPLGAVLAYIIGGLIAYMVTLGSLRYIYLFLVHLCLFNTLYWPLHRLYGVVGCIGSVGRQHLALNLPQQPFWYRNGSPQRRSGLDVNLCQW